MEKQEIGKFYATSFNGNSTEFIVYNDNTMDCPSQGIYSFKKLHIKPRFVMWKDRDYYIYNASSKQIGETSQLIFNYKIDEELFKYLKEKEMIKYSTDMAHLYRFSDKNGFDKGRTYSYNAKNNYKWVLKKAPESILEKQKKGYFN